MKSADTIASDLGVARRDIEERLNPAFSQQFSDHMEERSGCWYFDEEAQEFFRLLFGRGRREEGPFKGPLGASDVSAAAEEGLSSQTAASGKTAAEEEAALTDLQPPALHWARLPVVRAIAAPLNYRPEALAQAVEIQRRELTEFLTQFDRLVERLVPEEWNRKRLAGTPSKTVRLVGVAGRP